MFSSFATKATSYLSQWFPEMLAFMLSGPGLSHKLWLIVRQQEYPLSKELNKIQILCSNNNKKKKNNAYYATRRIPVTWTSTVAVNFP